MPAHPAILFPALRPCHPRCYSLPFAPPRFYSPSSFVIRDSFTRHSLHTTFRPKDRERLLTTKLSTSTRRHWFTLPQPSPIPDRYTANPSLPAKPSALGRKHRMTPLHPCSALDRYTANPSPPTKPSAHKRPVDRPVGLRVCRCRYRRRPLADVPKECAAIRLPESKRSFPERRAAWGWLPAAAFHPANPQPEASAGFLVPFSKKGTSFMRRRTSPAHPAILFPALRPNRPPDALRALLPDSAESRA